jgi:hypothetical protein
MDVPAVIPPGGGEVVGDAPNRRVEVLCDDEALHATSSRFGAGRDGADLHVHRRHNVPATGARGRFQRASPRRT